MKRHIRASYVIKNTDYFPILGNTNIKISPKFNEINSNTTTTTVSLSNKESTISPSFSHDDFLKTLQKIIH